MANAIEAIAPPYGIGGKYSAAGRLRRLPGMGRNFAAQTIIYFLTLFLLSHSPLAGALRPEEIVGQWRGDRGASYTVEYDGRVVTIIVDTTTGPVRFVGKHDFTSENPDSLIVRLSSGKLLDARKLSVLADNVPKSVIKELVESYGYKIRKEIGVVGGDPDRMYLAHIVDKIEFQGEAAPKVVRVIEEFDRTQESLSRIKDYKIDRVNFLVDNGAFEAKESLPLRRAFNVGVKFSKRPMVNTMWVSLTTSTGQSLRVLVKLRKDILSEQGTPEGSYRSDPIWLGPYGSAPGGYEGQILEAETGDEIRAHLDEAAAEILAGLATSVQVISVDYIPGASEALGDQAIASAIKPNFGNAVRDIWTAERIFVQAVIARGDDKPADTVFVNARAQTGVEVDIPLTYDELRSKQRATDVYRCDSFAMNDASVPFFWFRASWGSMDLVASGRKGHPDEEQVRFSLDDAVADVSVHRSLVKYVAARAREGLEYARGGYLHELAQLSELEQMYAHTPEFFPEAAPGEMEIRLQNSRVALEAKLRIVNNALALMDDPGMGEVPFKYGAQIAIAQQFAKLLPLDITKMQSPADLVVGANRPIPDGARKAGGVIRGPMYSVSSSNIESLKLSELEYQALSRAWARASDTDWNVSAEGLKRQVDDALSWVQTAGYLAFESSPLGSLNMLVRGQDISGRPAEFWDYILAGSDLILLGAGGAGVLKAGLKGFDTTSDFARVRRAASEFGGEVTARGAGALGSAVGDTGAARTGSLISPETGRAVLPPGSSAAPNSAIAAKLRDLKYGEKTAEDLSRLSPAELRRQLGMRSDEFDDFVAGALDVPRTDPSVGRYLESQLDRDRATKAFDELGIEPTNVDIAASAGRSTEETILWHGLLDGGEPKKVLDAAGLTEEQGRAMMRRSMIEQGVQENQVDALVEGMFNGRNAQRIAEARANPSKLPSKIPLTEEQIRQARIDVLEDLGKHEQAENLKKTILLAEPGEPAMRARRLESAVPGKTSRESGESVSDLGGQRGTDFNSRAKEKVASDNVPGGTARMSDESARGLGLERQAVDAADNLPGGTGRISDESLRDLGAQRRPTDATPPDDVFGTSTRTSRTPIEPSGNANAPGNPTVPAGSDFNAQRTQRIQSETPVARDAPITNGEDFGHRLDDLGIKHSDVTGSDGGFFDHGIITAQAKLRNLTEQEAIVYVGTRNRIPIDDVLRVAGVSADEAPVVLDRALAKANVPAEARSIMIERFRRGQPITEDSMGKLLLELPEVRYPGNIPLPSRPVSLPSVSPAVSGGSATPSGAGLPRD